MQGSQVLNGHLENLRLLQFPGTLQKEEELLVAAQRVQANPGRLGARIYSERTSEQEAAVDLREGRLGLPQRSGQALGREAYAKVLSESRLPGISAEGGSRGSPAPAPFSRPPTLPAWPGPWAPSCPARSNSD